MVNEGVHSLLDRVERRRRDVSRELSAKHRASLGQFFTPSSVADFLADRFQLPRDGPFRVLDPGAGVGSLSAAIAARVMVERPELDLHITAFEIDEPLISHLTATFEDCRAVAAEHGCEVTFEVRRESFVEYATGWLFETPAQYDACIANPPYKKVSATSPERVAAETCGLRASNLYTIFIGLAANLLAAGGQLSAIIPRSWANGPYHEPFRRFLLDRMGLDFLHVYEQRGKVFADAEVLQENVVLHAVRGDQPAALTLSTSAGGEDVRAERTVSIDEVLHPQDPHLFVRIPTDERSTRVAEQMLALPATLGDLGCGVSTGKVVDFRAREHLRDEPADDTVPLIYPGHLQDGGVDWPSPGSKKPNAIVGSVATAKLLVPNETYVLVRRFSAKEERRRVSAAVLAPVDLPAHIAAVGIENHLNVFHADGAGLDASLARGLCAYLNSTLVDDYVRSFSGHTQINATDLRQLQYPAPDDLVALGEALAGCDWPEQDELDALVAKHLRPVVDRALEPA